MKKSELRKIIQEVLKEQYKYMTTLFEFAKKIQESAKFVEPLAKQIEDFISVIEKDGYEYDLDFKLDIEKDYSFNDFITGTLEEGIYFYMEWNEISAKSKLDRKTLENYFKKAKIKKYKIEGFEEIEGGNAINISFLIEK